MVIFLSGGKMQSLSERLLATRKAKKMTQQQLAKKAGLSQATISDIERGRNSTTIEATCYCIRNRGTRQKRQVTT